MESPNLVEISDLIDSLKLRLARTAQYKQEAERRPLSAVLLWKSKINGGLFLSDNAEPHDSNNVEPLAVVSLRTGAINIV